MSRIVFIPSYVEQGVSMLNQAKQILAEIPTGVDAGIATIQGTNYNGGIPTFDTGSAASAEVSSLGGKIDYITQQIERYSNGGYIFQEGDLVILDPRDTESIEKYKKLGIKDNQIMSLENYESQRLAASWKHMGAKAFEGLVESMGSIIDGFASAVSLVTWGSWDDAIENFVQKDFASSMFDSLYAEGGAWEDMAKMSYASTSSKWATGAALAEGIGSAVPYMAAGMAMAPVAASGAAAVTSNVLGQAAVKVGINVAADAVLGSLGGLGRGTNEGMNEGMTMDQAMATKGLQQVKEEVKMSITAGLAGEVVGEVGEVVSKLKTQKVFGEAAEVAAKNALGSLDNATMKAASQLDDTLGAAARGADSMDSIATRLGTDNYNKLVTDPSEINKAVQDMAGKAGIDVTDVKAVDDFAVKYARDDVAASVRKAYTENMDEAFNLKYSDDIADIKKAVNSIDPTDGAKISDLSKSSVDDYIVSKYGNDALTNPQARIEADAKMAQFSKASPAEAKQMILQNELDTFKMRNQADFATSMEQKIAGDVDAAVKNFDALSQAQKVDYGKSAIAKDVAVSPEHQINLLKNQMPENTGAMADAVKGKLTDGLATNLSDKAGKRFDKLFGGAKTLDNATTNAATAMENAIRDAAAKGKNLSIAEIQDIGKNAAAKSIKYDALTTGNKAAKNALSSIDDDFAKDMRNVKKGKETLASVKDKYAPEVSNVKAAQQAGGSSKGLSTSAAQAAGGNPKGLSTNAQQAAGGNPKGLSTNTQQAGVTGTGSQVNVTPPKGATDGSPIVRESVGPKGENVKEFLDADGNVVNKEVRFDGNNSKSLKVENKEGGYVKIEDQNGTKHFQAQKNDGFFHEKYDYSDGRKSEIKNNTKEGYGYSVNSKPGEPTIKKAFDAQGRTLTETITDDVKHIEMSDGKGTVRDTIIKDGKTDDIIKYNDGSSVRTISENDRPVSITTETKNGKMVETITYDNAGNVSGRDIDVTSPDGSIKQSISIDESGNRIEITEDLNNNSRVTIETPKDGPTVTKYEDATGTVNKTVTTENLGNGQTRVTTDTVDGHYVETIDSVNNTRNIEVTGTDGTRQSIEFDSNGNRYEVTEYADNTRKVVETPKDGPAVTRYEDAAGNAIDPDSFAKQQMPETPSTILDEKVVYDNNYGKEITGKGPNGEKITITSTKDASYKTIEYPDGGVKVEIFDGDGKLTHQSFAEGNKDIRLGVYGTSAADSGMSFSEALSAVRNGTQGSDEYLEGLATLANKYGTGDGGLVLRTDLSSSLANAQNNAAYYARQFDLTGDQRYYNAFQEQLAEIGKYGDDFNDMVADQAEAYARSKNGLDLPECLRNEKSPYDIINGKPAADIDSPLDPIRADIDGKPSPDSLKPDVGDLEGRNAIDEINQGAGSGSPPSPPNGGNSAGNGGPPNGGSVGNNNNPPNPPGGGGNNPPGGGNGKSSLPPSNNPNLDPNTKTTKKITDNYGRDTIIEEVKGKGPDGDIVERTATGPKGDQTRTTVTTKTEVDPSDATKSTTTKTTKYETVDPDGNVTVKEKVETTINKYEADGKTLKEQTVETKYPERRIETKNSDGTLSSKKIGESTTNKKIEYSKNADGKDVIKTTSTTDGKTRVREDVITTKTENGVNKTVTETTVTAPNGDKTYITKTEIDEKNFTIRTKTSDGKIKTIESVKPENGSVRREITTREDLNKKTKTTKIEEYDLDTHTKTTATIDEKGKIRVAVDEADLDVHKGGTGLKSDWDETASSRNFAEKWYANRKGNFKTDVRDAFGETWITRRERMRYMKDEAGGLLHPFRRNRAYVARGREELAQIYAEQIAKKNGQNFISDEVWEQAQRKANNKWNFFQTHKAKKLGKEAIFDEGVARGLREVVEEAHEEGGEALIKRAATKEAVARAAAAAVGIPIASNIIGDIFGGGTETTVPPVTDTTAPPTTVPPYTPGPSPSPGGDDGGGGGTPEPTDTITDPSAVDPNETPTDTMTPTEPTDNITEEEIIAGVTDTNPGGDGDTGGNNGGGGYWGSSGGGQSFDDSVTEEILGDGITDEDALLGDEDLEGLEDEDDIYTIPLASGNSSTSKVTKDGINPIPILAGLGLVAAAGVGAKIYMDNKKNNENGEDDEFMDDSEFEDFSSKDSDLIADEWTGEETMNENTDEGLDYERPSFYSDTLGDEI